MIHKLTSLESFFFRGVMRCDESNPGRMCVIFTLLCLSGGGSRGGIDWKSELSAPIPVKSGRQLAPLHRRKKKGKKTEKLIILVQWRLDTIVITRHIIKLITSRPRGLIEDLISFAPTS